jgi:flotillin
MKVVACGPNEALIISGVFYGKEPAMIVGGRALVFPALQTIQKLPLSTITLVVKSPKVYTSQGVPISVTGVAQVKINGQNMDMLKAAAEQFGDKDEDEIAEIAKETLEGHQRAIMGTMSVEEIYRDRKKFSTSVFNVASTDLVNMGIMVISYTIKEITDDVGYLKALGMARTAEVQRDARVGEAQAKMQSTIAEAKAEMQRMESKLMNDTEIARFKRDYDFKKAGYDVEVNTAKASADLAYTLQAALMQQQIKEQETQVMVIERMQEIELQEQEIQRKEKELESKIRRPAEAEKYRLETIAEANRQRAVLEAEAEAEAIALKGDAKAFAIEAKAKAEAEQMAKKADAWNEYGKAALMDMMLKMMPKVAAEIAAPLSRANKITMISDSASDIGASKLTGEVLSIMGSIPDVVEKMTGVDISKQMAERRN